MAHVPGLDWLGDHRAEVERVLDRLAEERIVARIWERDHTVWKPDPEEIENRLGWLAAPREMVARLEPVDRFVADARAGGYSHALLMGMGGSSLAAEVFQRVFGTVESGLELAVLDSTDPGAVRAVEEAVEPERTMFLVSSKSGTTTETLSFFKFLYNRVAERLGEAAAGERFVAVTDPGTPLAEAAGDRGFRVVFLNDPEVGGRYSALTYFGLVPAALVGVDVRRLLERAGAAAEACRRERPHENPGARLGAILGTLAVAGRDKLTLVASPPIAPFGEWVEQLVAESTGKEGTGILPVVGEPPGRPERYGGDRLFVHLRFAEEEAHDEPVAAIAEAGHPVVRMEVREIYDLGEQFFVWEFATAVAGHLLGIHPFDQPNVETAKRRARESLDAYRESGELPEEAPVARAGGVAVHADLVVGSPEEAVDRFVERAAGSDYVAVQAYLPPMPGIDAALGELGMALREATGRATTVGYGPRYLHSTGQLHKGDAGDGAFLMITAEPDADLPIPEEAGSAGSEVSFGTLERAQALGDLRALLDAGRFVVRVHLEKDPRAGLERVIAAIG